MESSEIKKAISRRVGAEPEVIEGIAQLEEARGEGYNSYLEGQAATDVPYSDEGVEAYLYESWLAGWKEAYSSVVLAAIVTMARKLVEAESTEEVDHYFDNLKEACLAMEDEVYEEFASFIEAQTDPGPEEFIDD